MVLVGDTRDPLEIEYVSPRDPKRLTEERLRTRAIRRSPLVEVVRILHGRGLDPQLGQRVVKKVIGPSVERCRRHDMPRIFREIKNGESFRT